MDLGSGIEIGVLILESVMTMDFLQAGGKQYVASDKLIRWVKALMQYRLAAFNITHVRSNLRSVIFFPPPSKIPEVSTTLIVLTVMPLFIII